MILLEVPDDVEEADVGANDAGEEADDEDEGVLQGAEDELRASVCVPVDRSVNLSVSFKGQWKKIMMDKSRIAKFWNIISCLLMTDECGDE